MHERAQHYTVEDSVDVEEDGFLVQYGSWERKATIANHYALMLNADRARDRVDVVLRNAYFIESHTRKGRITPLHLRGIGSSIPRGSAIIEISASSRGRHGF